MSYSEKDGQVILTMSREECEKEILRLLREFDDRKMPVNFAQWHKRKFGKPRLHARLNQGNPNYTPYQVEK